MENIHTHFKTLYEKYTKVVPAVDSDISQGFVNASIVLILVCTSFFLFTILVQAAVLINPFQTVEIEAIQRDIHTVDIMLRNNTTLLNAVEIELYFDPNSLYVNNLTIATALCEDRFRITKEIDNVRGRIFYQCGTITPFSGTSTKLATVTVSPFNIGTSTLSFGSSTNALAHDGYGTNVTKNRLLSFFTFSG